MKFIGRWLRRALIWLLPAVVLLLVTLSAFLVWSIGSETGTRWLLKTAVSQVEGQIQGIEGSIWKGLRIGKLAIKVPVVDLSLEDLYLQVEWRELVQRRLHARDLSVGKLSVDILQSEDKEKSEEPFALPKLPVTIDFDHIALGELNMSINNEPLLVSVQNLAASLGVTEKEARLVFASLRVGREAVQADIEGEVKLLDLSEPWPLDVTLKTHAQSSEPNSVLCVRRFLPDLPVAKPQTEAKTDASALSELSELSAACALDIEARVTGTMDRLNVAVLGTGQDVEFHFNSLLAPRASFPLQHAALSIALADGSSLDGDLTWDVTLVDGVTRDHVVGSLRSDRLNIGMLVGDGIPEAVLTTRINVDAQLVDHTNLLSADVAADIAKGSVWNKHPLAGSLKAKVINTTPVAPASSVPSASPAPPYWKGLQLAGLDTDLRLGTNRVLVKGDLGAQDSNLNLDVVANRLADFWPDLPGGVQVKGRVSGSLANHAADVRLVYTPENSKRNEIGKAPLEAKVVVSGQWGKVGPPAGALEGWMGTVSELQARHAGLTVGVASPVKLLFAPKATALATQWQVGATTIQLALPSGKSFRIAHALSQGAPGRWETRGAVERLAVSRSLIEEIQDLLKLTGPEEKEKGGVKVKSQAANADMALVLGADWDLKFAGTLQGRANLRRVGGDVMVPGEPDFALGLRTLDVDIVATPEGAAASRLTADVNVATEKMGRATATLATLIRSTPGGGIALDPKDLKTVRVNADMQDLSWVNIMLGDAMDIGGSLHADLEARSRPDGTWVTNGTMTGENMRFVRIDDGVRLLDGTLRAHFDDNRFVLDGLRFPARLRVTPKEWRTDEWVRTNPGAKGGFLNVTGAWDLSTMIGGVNIEFYRYPLLQRTDRYAMVSGNIKVDAPMPNINIEGSLTADAGWFDLDMLSTVPTLDGDVVVLRGNETLQKPKAPMNINLRLKVDLGPRFYITGYGVNSGLVGDMEILMSEGKMTAYGALRTRGGAIEAYGQRLQLRRGTITFQGDIANPVLNIEALRTGVAVEAGVRVAGTARRPRIDLVSYPDVSDVQKLSWLLLGRGPDESGGDAALLFSVGTSFLGDGEPFYRRFGLDELSMRSGELGSTGSILPVESVVRGLDSGASEVENQFVVASKKVSDNITLSLEQALSGAGTVGRASYRLTRGLSAQISAGTVTGIALVYRVLFGR